MKSYTDLEQSKALAKILPIESADMHSEAIDDEGDMVFIIVDGLGDKTKLNYGSPIWSLAALLDVLPFPSLHKTFSGWRCDSYNKEGTSCILGEPSNSHVDACVETIFNLVCCGYDFRKTDGTLPSRTAR